MCSVIEIRQNSEYVGEVDSQVNLKRIAPIKYWSSIEDGEALAYDPECCLCPIDLELIADRMNIQHRNDWDEHPWGPTWEISGCENEDKIVEELKLIREEEIARYKKKLEEKK